MAQKTTTIALSDAEIEVTLHALGAAQTVAITQTKRTDATLSRVEKKIVEAKAKAAVKAAPKDDDGDADTGE